jgi:hypothetical protein
MTGPLVPLADFLVASGLRYRHCAWMAAIAEPS